MRHVSRREAEPAGVSGLESLVPLPRLYGEDLHELVVFSRESIRDLSGHVLDPRR